MSSERCQRIEASCKVIWGNDYDYDFDSETDDWEFYQCHVKKDFGDHYGTPLIMTSLCEGSEAAWAELERMLDMKVREATRGRPMNMEEILEYAGGPNGEHKNLLRRFLIEMEKYEVAEKKATSENAVKEAAAKEAGAKEDTKGALKKA